MYKVTPEDFDTLVRESQKRRTDPRGVALVLMIESAGFNPASAGPGGKGGANGLNQMTPKNLGAIGFTPEAWRALSAAEQLPIIFKWWDGVARDFSGGVFPVDAANLLAMNFLPERYRLTKHDENAPLTKRGDADGWYEKNTYYDPKGTGIVSVSTIRDRQALDARGARWAELNSGILAALQRALAPAPSPGPPELPDAPTEPTAPVPAVPAPPPPLASVSASRVSPRAKGIGLVVVALAGAFAAARACGKVP